MNKKNVATKVGKTSGKVGWKILKGVGKGTYSFAKSLDRAIDRKVKEHEAYKRIEKAAYYDERGRTRAGGRRGAVVSVYANNKSSERKSSRKKYSGEMEYFWDEGRTAENVNWDKKKKKGWW
ncbi:MAG: hypothetical protein ABH873_03065 [Candidatus Firestonebacteria bacterium]